MDIYRDKVVILFSVRRCLPATAFTVQTRHAVPVRKTVTEHIFCRLLAPLASHTSGLRNVYHARLCITSERPCTALCDVVQSLPQTPHPNTHRSTSSPRELRLLAPGYIWETGHHRCTMDGMRSQLCRLWVRGFSTAKPHFPEGGQPVPQCPSTEGKQQQL
jgi:hypothetical protein